MFFSNIMLQTWSGVCKHLTIWCMSRKLLHKLKQPMLALVGFLFKEKNWSYLFTCMYSSVFSCNCHCDALADFYKKKHSYISLSLFLFFQPEKWQEGNSLTSWRGRKNKDGGRDWTCVDLYQKTLLQMKSVMICNIWNLDKFIYIHRVNTLLGSYAHIDHFIRWTILVNYLDKQLLLTVPDILMYSLSVAIFLFQLGKAHVPVIVSCWRYNSNKHRLVATGLKIIIPDKDIQPAASWVQKLISNKLLSVTVHDKLVNQLLCLIKWPVKKCSR